MADLYLRKTTSSQCGLNRGRAEKEQESNLRHRVNNTWIGFGL